MLASQLSAAEPTWPPCPCEGCPSASEPAACASCISSPTWDNPSPAQLAHLASQSGAVSWAPDCTGLTR